MWGMLRAMLARVDVAEARTRRGWRRRHSRPGDEARQRRNMKPMFLPDSRDVLAVASKLMDEWNEAVV